MVWNREVDATGEPIYENITDLPLNAHCQICGGILVDNWAKCSYCFTPEVKSIEHIHLFVDSMKIYKAIEWLEESKNNAWFLCMFWSATADALLYKNPEDWKFALPRSDSEILEYIADLSKTLFYFSNLTDILCLWADYNNISGANILTEYSEIIMAFHQENDTCKQMRPWRIIPTFGEVEKTLKFAEGFNLRVMNHMSVAAGKRNKERATAYVDALKRGEEPDSRIRKNELPFPANATTGWWNVTQTALKLAERFEGALTLGAAKVRVSRACNGPEPKIRCLGPQRSRYIESASAKAWINEEYLRDAEKETPDSPHRW